jgi:predicted amidohydrolase
MPLLGVAQMTSSNDVNANFDVVTALARKARMRGAEVLSLPECFAFMGESDGDVVRMMEPLEGPLLQRYRELAKELGMWLALGGFPEKGPDDAHAYNTHVVINAQGQLTAAYRKLHLFDVEIGVSKYLESGSTTAGGAVVVTDSPVGKLGLSVCYDLRFPELYLTLAGLGAQVLLVPAAFTLTTGKEHWEALLRARAIENQCYVAAAAQTGRHNPRRDTFGHAMIIDPWGTIIAQCSDGAGVAVADVDASFIAAVRQRIPVWRHRRADVYGAVGLKPE